MVRIPDLMIRGQNMSAAKVSQAVIANAIAAIQSAGLTPVTMRIGADGSLTIDIAQTKLNTAANDPDPKGPKKWGQNK